VVPGNAYFVEDLEGRSLSKALNGKYFKVSILPCGRADKGDYRVKVDWWNREARTVKGNHSV
jgi:hypothetical protein